MTGTGTSVNSKGNNQFSKQEGKYERNLPKKIPPTQKSNFIVKMKSVFGLVRVKSAINKITIYRYWFYKKLLMI